MCVNSAVLAFLLSMPLCQEPSKPAAATVQENVEVTIRPGETIRAKTIKTLPSGEIKVEIDPRDKSELMNQNPRDKLVVKQIWEAGQGPIPVQAPIPVVSPLTPPPPRVSLPPMPIKPQPPLIKISHIPRSLVGLKSLPPPEYDHHYEGWLTIKIVDSHAALLDLCSSPGKRVSNDTLACARRLDFGERCLVHVLREDLMQTYSVRGWTMDILLRHEIGHCNGWPGTHPDARPIPATP